MITRDMEGEVRFLKNRYRSMQNRVNYSRSYSDVENEYGSEEEFIEHWKGRVDWQSNPHLDRIDSDGNYCKSKLLKLSKPESLVGSLDERTTSLT